VSSRSDWRVVATPDISFKLANLGSDGCLVILWIQDDDFELAFAGSLGVDIKVSLFLDNDAVWQKTRSTGGDLRCIFRLSADIDWERRVWNVASTELDNEFVRPCDLGDV
jgi:hypothetical protein